MVIPGSTLVPVNSLLPGLTGSETVVSGTTYVNVPSATTVPEATSLCTTCPVQVTGGNAGNKIYGAGSGVIVAVGLAAWAAW